VTASFGTIATPNWVDLKPTESRRPNRSAA
jgi:hypothetical protein